MINDPIIRAFTVKAGMTETIDFALIKGQNVSATFLQLQNLDNPCSDILVYVNDQATPFTLRTDSTQIFNSGDVSINKLVFDNTKSGNVDTRIELIASITN
jgi:hypothetical protein